MTQCSKCVMDGSSPEIVLTETGCNFCDQARKSLKENEQQKGNLDSIIKDIKLLRCNCDE